jgi:general secretion pathway protein D
MTDTQSNIRHITEIVSALDNVTSSTTSITNFALRYADAKSVASLLKDLFPNSDSSKNNGGGGGFGGGRFRGFGGGGFPGFGGGGGGGSDSSSENGHTPQIKVNAVSDDHSNTLLVTAPDDLLPTIAEIVTSLDQAVEDQTEVRVFSLKNADATEMAELLTSLFPDESANSSDATRSPFRFGPFGGFGQQQSASSQTSERAKKMSKVTAVADRRTSSVVVTAGKDMMPQIVAMVDELDKSRARKQSAHVIPLANADPVDVQTILQELFPTSSGSGSSRSGSSSSSSSQNNYLQNRAQTQLQQQNSTTTGSFGTSTGSSGSGRGF